MCLCLLISFIGGDLAIDNNYCVYIHIFPDNKKYVGITKQTPEARWGINGNGYKTQPVYEAIKKYGWNNIKHYVLYDRMSADEAILAEKDLIQKYDCINNGYNLSSGGDLGSECFEQFEYDGKLYTSKELADLSDVENITYHDITNRINTHGWSIQEALSKPLMKKNQLFEYNGKYYTTKELANMSNVKGITPRHIINRINRRGWDVERAITQPLNVKKEPKGNKGFLYEYKGKTYKSYELAEISPIDGMTQAIISSRINDSGWSVEKAITTPIKKRNALFEWQGKMYSSKELAELSPVKDITYHDITDRIRSGWCMVDVMYKPKDCKHARLK